MQRFLFNSLYIFLFFGFFSCASDTESGDILFENNPLKNHYQIYSFSNETHLIELYARDTSLYEGYNDVLLRIKDINDEYISYADIEWEVATDEGITGPIAKINRSVDNPDVYTSFLIFPKNTYDKIWNLHIIYKIQSTTYEATTNLEIRKPNSNRITILEETGLDNKDYLLTLIDPYSPIAGHNNCSMIVFEQLSSTEFVAREDLFIHVWNSSGDYIQDDIVEIPFRANTNKYQGKIEIPGTGLWRLNLFVKNESGSVILGEEKSANHQTSSLHFPLNTEPINNL